MGGALGWDLDRVEAALGCLDVVLSKTGLRLGCDGNRIRIEGRPGRLGPDTRAALARSGSDDGRVDPDIARAVWGIAFTDDARGRVTVFDTVVGVYRKRLVAYDGSRMQVSDAVAFSLMLGERP